MGARTREPAPNLWQHKANARVRPRKYLSSPTPTSASQSVLFPPPRRVTFNDDGAARGGEMEAAPVARQTDEPGPPILLTHRPLGTSGGRRRREVKAGASELMGLVQDFTTILRGI